MPSPTGKTIAPSAQPALDLISLARLSHELACQNLRAILLANPNYFGNVSGSSLKAVLNIKGDTVYESITGVSYCPQLQQLRATIKIKQDNGYSLGIGTDGSQEYVRFYLSYDDGATWQDQGLSAVYVINVPGPKPIVFLVTLQFNPDEDFGLIENLPRVRAILSWNSPPPAATPDWTPVWGNVMDAQIQIEGIKQNLVSRLLPESQIQFHEQIVQTEDPGQLDNISPQKAKPIESKSPYDFTMSSRLPYLESAGAKALSSAAPFCALR